VVQHSRSGNAALPGLIRLIVACIRCRTCCRKFYRPRVML